MSRVRIVVIDDNPGDVLLLRYAFDRHEEAYDLEVLKDGEEALHFIREYNTHRHASQPCVIVLDLHLPRYDGLAVLRAIKREPALADIHVVIFTTQATPEEEREMLKLGVRLYCPKPMNLDDLTSVAEQILEICKEPAAVV